MCTNHQVNDAKVFDVTMNSASTDGAGRALTVSDTIHVLSL